VFTGVQPSAEDLAAIEAIGGTHVATPQDATHMIAQSAAHKVPLKRTPKLLMGISRCKVRDLLTVLVSKPWSDNLIFSAVRRRSAVADRVGGEWTSTRSGTVHRSRSGC
jgi:hypothetical protein